VVSDSLTRADRPVVAASPIEVSAGAQGSEAPTDGHYTIAYGDTEHSDDTIFGPYLPGPKSVVVEDPYIRMPHQVASYPLHLLRLADWYCRSPREVRRAQAKPARVRRRSGDLRLKDKLHAGS
jgi:hypothetical protein